MSAFQGCHVSGADFRYCYLEGVIIDSDQAAMLGRLFATLLGMEVKEG